MVNPADAIQKAASLSGCIDAARAAGELDRARATALKNTLADLEARYSAIMPEPAAKAQAARDVRAAVERGLPARYHSTLAQLQAMQRLRAQIEGSARPDLALKSLLKFSEARNDTGESVESLQAAYITRINGSIRDALAATGENLIGQSRDSKLLMRTLDELHGDDTGDAVARRLADQIRAIQEELRVAFNAHGGNIGKLEDFGLSHTHDVARMRRQGFDAWRDTIAPRLDWSRITDFATGQPFARKKGEIPDRAVTDRFLKDVYENVTTRGWNTSEATMGAQGRALYNKRGDHRVLHFQSGKAWREYNKHFGNSDLFSSLIGGLHGMGREIALMRVLGPNPRMGLQFAEAVARKAAATSPNAKQAERWLDLNAWWARATLTQLDGSASLPAHAAWGAFYSGIRSTLTSIQLGTAVLAAIPSDPVFQALAARHMGINPLSVYARGIKLIASSATRQDAARMGYVADTLADAMASTARFTGEMYVPPVARKLAGFTMRATGLSYWTDMARVAVQMEFAGFLAGFADQTYDGLPDKLRRAFSQRGISAFDWDMLRAPEGRHIAPNGADFISPIAWLEKQTALPRDQAEGLAMRLQMLVEEFKEAAIPTNSAEMRAFMQAGATPGTPGGELVQSFMMYKSFAISLTATQVRRIMAMPGRLNKFGYATALVFFATLAGAHVIQLREIAKGRDPRPMDTPSFWLAAALQGGGFGIFGDFFSSEMSRSGGGLAETAAGPMIGLIGDSIRLFTGPLSSVAEGQDHNLGRGVSQFFRENTPFFSSAWYARAAFDRAVADTLQRFLDPEAEANWKRQERQRERDFGNATWWERGDLLPFRAPDPANALGGSR